MDEGKDMLQNQKGIKVEINRNKSSIKRVLSWSKVYIN
jgi:hypothetical protein